MFEEGNNGVDRSTNPDGYREFIDTLQSQIRTGGKTMDYTHNYSLSYNIPLDKFPLTNWLSANAKYAGTFNWQRAPLGQNQFGNTIQNSRTIKMTAQGNFMTLYNKIPFFKKVLGDSKNSRATLPKVQTPTGNNKPNAPKPEVKQEYKPWKPLDEMTPKELKKYERLKKRFEKRLEREEKRKEKEKEKASPVAGFFVRVITSVRNVSGTYALNDGTMLPGFSEETSVLGMNGTTLGLSSFVFGKQGYSILGKENGYNVADLSRQNSWLVQNENLNRQFTTTHSSNLTAKATLEPFKDFNINLNLTRNYGTNSGEFYRWNDLSQAFESQSKFETSRLTYSTITWNSAFVRQGRDYQSAVFQTLLDNRQVVSQLIGSRNGNSSSLPSGYYDGYSGSQQDVVLGAFLTAYTNSKVSDRNINPIRNIPLPNWTINYSGLTQFEFTKNFLKSFKLSHAYSSSVSVDGMQTNLNGTVDANGFANALDINNNFISPMQIQNVRVSEKFSPLIGILATWKIFGKTLTTNFEYKKSRDATLSMNNNQITENLGSEITFGTVLNIPKLKLPFDGIKQNDLIVNINFSLRDNLTVIRKVVENTNQATAGQKAISFKLDANYKLTDHLTVIFYYDQSLNIPKVQTSYVTGSMKTGMTIRFDLNALKQ
jgi:cell surface protein SprA